MTDKEILSWMIDAYVMIGTKNDDGEDEGKCLLNALIKHVQKEVTK